MRRLSLCLCLLVATAIVGGCGGHKSYTVGTGGSGSLRGLRTIPADGERDVHVDATIEIYWVAGYEPPPEFKFVLWDEDDEKVLTTQKSSDNPKSWRFEPTWDLEYDKVYVIEVTSGDDRKTFAFLTEDDDGVLSLSASKDEPEKRSPDGPTPQQEHIVKTGR